MISLSAPWYVRIGGKLVLSRLPISYRLWKSLGLFAHGEMQNHDYALGVFQHHYNLSGISGEFVGLEMGPGDSLLSAVAAKSFGSTKYYLVDVGDFADKNVEVYRAAAKHLRSKGRPAPELTSAKTLADVLSICSATYAVDGLESYRTIPDASVDFVWSHAVLEHVRRAEFLEIMREVRRVLKPGGVASHQVDLQDHLGGALNNMRIGSKLWEADWFATSGFYTNRLRFSEMCDLFVQAGFEVEVVNKNVWPQSPIKRDALAPEFRNLSDDDLRVKDFCVILRPHFPATVQFEPSQ